MYFTMYAKNLSSLKSKNLEGCGDPGVGGGERRKQEGDGGSVILLQYHDLRMVEHKIHAHASPVIAHAYPDDR